MLGKPYTLLAKRLLREVSGWVASDFVLTYITAGPDCRVSLYSVNGCSLAGFPD